jgi:putative oxidoreductase
MKNLFIKVTDESSFFQSLSLTFLRVFAGASMAFAHGMSKVPPSEKFVGYLSGMGFPSPEIFAWSAGLAEFLGGIFLAIGLFTRASAFFVAVTMFVAAFVAHAADPFQERELALMYFAVCLVFVVRGSSRFSVDRLFR